jgi:multicomponent Na+:H+ antiporter subunit C
MASIEALGTLILAKYNYWAVILLILIGLYAMIAKKNMVKKIIGMNIFQTAIILFYVSIGSKRGATLPIIEHVHGESVHAVHAVDYINPLPQVLMLTAIVVSVATLGVALALAMKIYFHYETLEEDEIQQKIIGLEPGQIDKSG